MSLDYKEDPHWYDILGAQGDEISDSPLPSIGLGRAKEILVSAALRHGVFGRGFFLVGGCFQVGSRRGPGRRYHTFHWYGRRRDRYCWFGPGWNCCLWIGLGSTWSSWWRGRDAVHGNRSNTHVSFKLGCVLLCRGLEGSIRGVRCRRQFLQGDVLRGAFRLGFRVRLQ